MNSVNGFYESFAVIFCSFVNNIVEMFLEREREREREREGGGKRRMYLFCNYQFRKLLFCSIY